MCLGRKNEWTRCSEITVIGVRAPTTVLNVSQVELSHRDVFVFLDRRLTLALPDVHDFVLRVAIYKRQSTPRYAGTITSIRCLHGLLPSPFLLS